MIIAVIYTISAVVKLRPEKKKKNKTNKHKNKRAPMAQSVEHRADMREFDSGRTNT